MTFFYSVSSSVKCSMHTMYTLIDTHHVRHRVAVLGVCSLLSALVLVAYTPNNLGGHWLLLNNTRSGIGHSCLVPFGFEGCGIDRVPASNGTTEACVACVIVASIV